MKSKVIKFVPEKKFEPLVLEITFETMDECLEMYARLNMSGEKVAVDTHHWNDMTYNLNSVRTALRSASRCWENIGERVAKHIREQA